MSSKRIVELPEVKDLYGFEKIPIGGRGDVSTTMDTIFKWLTSKNISGIPKELKAEDMPLLPYHNSQGDLRFGYSAVQEIIDSFYGGNSYTTQPVIAPYKQTNIFRFFDLANQMNTPQVFGQGSTSSRFKIPISQITASTENLSTISSDFRGYDVNGQGFSSFKYVGDRPLYGNIIGDFKILLRVGNEGVTPHKTPILWFNITATPKPTFEYLGSKTFAVDGTNITKTVINIESSSYSPRNKSYQDWLEEYNDIISLSYINQSGYIPANWTNDLLLSTNLENNLTTQWLTIPPSRKVITSTDKEVSLFRIQVVLSDGTIAYLGNDTSNANAILSFPANSVKWRVCYQLSDNQSPEFIPPKLTIKNMRSSDSTFSGSWAEYNFNFNSFFSFYPEFEYSLELWVWESSKQIQVDDFVMQSGYLAIDSNARKKIQDKYDKVVFNGS